MQIWILFIQLLKLFRTTLLYIYIYISINIQHISSCGSTYWNNQRFCLNKIEKVWFLNNINKSQSNVLIVVEKKTNLNTFERVGFARVQIRDCLLCLQTKRNLVFFSSIFRSLILPRYQAQLISFIRVANCTISVQYFSCIAHQVVTECRLKCFRTKCETSRYTLPIKMYPMRNGQTS